METSRPPFRINSCHECNLALPPLAGVSIDPSRRDVYAVVGTPSVSEQPADFFIHWKSRSGKSYAVIFSEGTDGTPQLLEIQPSGDMRLLASRESDRSRQEVGRQQGELAQLNAQLRPVIDALPAAIRSP